MVGPCTDGSFATHTAIPIARGGEVAPLLKGVTTHNRYASASFVQSEAEPFKSARKRNF